jgi:penicillin amidase
MRVFRRALIGFGVVLLLAAAGLAGLMYWSLPPKAVVADIPGLSAPVHIELDVNGIPRIEAATAEDGAAALGFMHARDRMFQMDLGRRVASGRLSEIAGSATLRLDRTMRILGLRRRAEADLGHLQPETRALLEAYARGVNAWIGLRGRFSAPEFAVLGAPAPWSPVDSLLWGKTMSLYLSGNWRQELERSALLSRMTPAEIKALWPAQDGTPAPQAGLGEAAARLAALVPQFPDAFTLPSSASNEWAVDGSHSATGAPLLAGDPHLGFPMPAVWYLARIQTPGVVLAGATAPGVPFLIIGHNGRIAWTFTTTGADTQDVFVETPAGDGQYATPDGPRPFAVHDETIHVLFGADSVLHVRETRHGPVISDLDPTPGPVLAVAMTGLAPDDTAPDGLLALNRAGTVAEAGRAAPLIMAPVQNLLVADKAGIGQFTTGRVPVRRAGDGTLPVQGADGAHDWTGTASGDALPHVVNPASGRIVNANERVAPPDFPVFLGQDWFGDWRARRIRTLLDARSTHSVASFAEMQADATSSFAQAVLPRLLQTKPADPASVKALAALRRWDGTMRIDWWQPLLFNDWMTRLQHALMERRKTEPYLSGVQSDMLARALGPEEAQWCGPDCGTMLTQTLSAAAAASGPGDQWGTVHHAEFQHPLLGRIPLLGRLFTWHIEQPGDDTTVFRGSPRATITGGEDWTAVHGPAFRGVYDLSDLERSVFALAPGQSGNPLVAQADSLIHTWRAPATVRLGASAKVDDTIELRPADGKR